MVKQPARVTQISFAKKERKLGIQLRISRGDLQVGRRVSGRWAWDWLLLLTVPLLLFAFLYKARTSVDALSHALILNFQKFSLRFSVRECFEVEVLSAVL